MQLLSTYLTFGTQGEYISNIYHVQLMEGWMLKEGPNSLFRHFEPRPLLIRTRILNLKEVVGDILSCH